MCALCKEYSHPGRGVTFQFKEYLFLFLKIGTSRPGLDVNILYTRHTFGGVTFRFAWERDTSASRGVRIHVPTVYGFLLCCGCPGRDAVPTLRRRPSFRRAAVKPAAVHTVDANTTVAAIKTGRGC